MTTSNLAHIGGGSILTKSFMDILNPVEEIEADKIISDFIDRGVIK